MTRRNPRPRAPQGPVAKWHDGTKGGSMTQFRLGPQHKSFPPSSWGATLADFRAEGRRVSEFHTPLLTLDRSALDHNTTRMLAWCRERGLDLAPHGKTTMAPVLWQELTDAGAWAITVATAWQAQVAVSQGVGRVLVANELIDPVGLGWIDTHLRDPEATSQVLCWADSLAAVPAMEHALGAEGPALDVLVELGPGAATGPAQLHQYVQRGVGGDYSGLLPRPGGASHE